MNTKIIDLKRQLTVEEAISIVNANAKQVADVFLSQAKDYKASKPSYVCPICNNGTGADGTGLKFTINAKGEPALKCFKCDTPLGNLINYVGYKLGYGPNDFTGKNFINIINTIGDRLNFTVTETNDTYEEAKRFIPKVSTEEVIECKLRELRENYVQEPDPADEDSKLDLSKCKKLEPTVYTYYDLENRPIKAKIKTEWIDTETGERVKKEFSQRDLKNDRNDFNLLTDEEKDLLYNAYCIEKAKREEKKLFYVEGEKDVDNLMVKGGVLATTIGNAKKLSDISIKMLEGIKEILIIPDYDIPGYRTAIENFKRFKDAGIKTSILNWPLGTPKGYDISDFLEQERVQGKREKTILEQFITTEADIEEDTRKLEERLNIMTGKDKKPKTIDELIKSLKEVGESIREKSKKTKIEANEIAKILNSLCYCKIIKFNDKKIDSNPVMIYNSEQGIYTNSDLYIDSLIKAIEENCSTNKIAQIKADLKVILYTNREIEEPNSNPNLAIFNNGIFNRKTRELIEFSPAYIFTSKLAINYNPNAKHPNFSDNWNVDKWIKEDIAQKDTDKEYLAWQAIAQCIFFNEINKIAYLLYDEKSNTGKSTFIQLCRNMVGANNCASANLEQLEERFTPGAIAGASLITGDDNNHSMTIKFNSNFKSIVSGDSILVEMKGKDSTSYSFRSTVIQAMNGFPRLKIDDGLLNRIRVLGFPTSYKGKNINYNVKERYIYNKDLLEYVAFKATTIKTRPIRDTDENKKYTENLSKLSDDVIAFIEDVIDLIESIRIPTTYLYDLYKYWSNNQQAVEKLGRNQFTARAEAQLESLGYTKTTQKILEDNFNPRQDIENIGQLINANKQELEEFIKASKNYIGKSNVCFTSEL